MTVATLHVNRYISYSPRGYQARFCVRPADPPPGRVPCVIRTLWSSIRLDGMAFEQTPAERREVTVRRAPKYVPFLIAGALAGIVAAAVVAYAAPGDSTFDPGAVFGFFLIMFAAVGAILGAALALVLDRRSVRRQERAVVEAVPDSETDTGPQD